MSIHLLDHDQRYRARQAIRYEAAASKPISALQMSVNTHAEMQFGLAKRLKLRESAGGFRK